MNALTTARQTSVCLQPAIGRRNRLPHFVLLVFVQSALAQGTLADYQRAVKFLPANLGKLILNAQVHPTWLPQSEQFCYERQTLTGKESVLIDPVGGTRKFVAACAPAAEKKPAPGEMLSPDGRWAAFVRDHNLYVRGPGGEIRLTSDGAEDNDYASEPGYTGHFITDLLAGTKIPPDVLWSPNSKKLLTYKLDQRAVPKSYLLQSVPPDGPRPRVFSFPAAVPGGKVALQKLMAFDVASKRQIVFDSSPIPVFPQQTLSGCWWSNDSEKVFFLQSERGFVELSLKVASTRDGATRTLIDERTAPPVLPGPTPNGVVLQIVGNGEEVIWYSERDGWGHFYLYDAKTGALKNQITHGPWMVRNIEYVDEQGRWLYFTAGGVQAGQDPYEVHLYRVKLDGTGMQPLTPEEGQHTIQFSPSHRFLIDTWSQVNVPHITVLRHVDGTRVTGIGELEKADISRLLALGYRMPEPFHVKALDGKTDLYGILYRPSNFDPNKRYPIVESIYPGPLTISTPKTFDTAATFPYSQGPAIAELGFLVVILDGFGTPLRSPAFHRYYYGRMGDAADPANHVEAIKNLGKIYPYIDLNRVGIYGHSGGGVSSARAMLEFPDFYKVAVSSSGTHDRRGYIPRMGELGEGMPKNEEYLVDAITGRLASRLKGKLMLVYGDMDDNVPPAQTLQFINELIKANKNFDLLVMPNRNHAATANDHYFWRRRWDYFVKYLLNVEPPEGFQIP
jgi:dipeptidyl aminopeptidase/acylaminoacyl peptidase